MVPCELPDPAGQRGVDTEIHLITGPSGHGRARAVGRDGKKIRQAVEFGYRIIGPGAGELACLIHDGVDALADFAVLLVNRMA